MLCDCDDVEHGKDYIVEDWEAGPVPPPSQPEARLARFLAMTTRAPFTSTGPAFSWESYLSDNAAELLNRRASALPKVMELVASTESSIYSTSADKVVLKCLRMKAGHEKDGPDGLRAATRQGAERLLNFDWTRITKFEVTLVNNAFQRSDPKRFPISDQDLKIVYEVIEAFMRWFTEWTSSLGWHISLET